MLNQHRVGAGLVATLTLALAACGGGGGGSSTPTAASAPGPAGAPAPAPGPTASPIVLSAVTPSTVTQGDLNVTALISGTGFDASSATVSVNGVAHATTAAAGGAVSFHLSAADLANAATLMLSLSDTNHPTSSSNTLPFTVIAGSTDAVSYQIDTAHDGFINFYNSTLPSSAAWSVTLNGTVLTALSSNGLVYAMTSSEIEAIDQNTGALVWGPIAIVNSPGATYENNQVFVVNNDIGNAGVLVTLNAATGVQVRTTTLAGQYYFSAPPVASHGIVTTSGAGSGGTIYAVSETSGAVLWTAGVANGQEAAPAVTQTGLYVDYPCQYYDFNPTSGASIWADSEGCDGGGGNTVAVANGIVYALNPNGELLNRMISASNGALMGTFTGNLPAVTSTVRININAGNLVATSLANNQLLWNFGGDGGLTGSPIVVGTMVFVGSTSGKVFGVDLATGNQIWVASVANGVNANNYFTGSQSLSAGNGLLFVPNGTALTAFRLSAAP